MFKKLQFMALAYFFFRDPAANETAGFNETETAQLKSALGEMQEQVGKKNLEGLEVKIKEHLKPVNEALEKFSKYQGTVDELKEDVRKNQEGVDKVLSNLKGLQKDHGNTTEAKSLQEAIMDAMQDQTNQEGMKAVAKGRPFTLELKGLIDMSAPTREVFNPKAREAKAAGDMTQANILTGQGFVSYNNRQVILPAQKVNARDLVPVTQSPTGIYVTYKETPGQGAPAYATEGSTKPQLDFRFSRIELVLNYIAATARFSKQLMTNLGYLQSWLPRLMQREFFKVENRRFWDQLYTAFLAGGTVPDATDTDDLLQMMDWIVQLADTDYNPSYGLMRYAALNNINKSILTKGYYPGAGGITSGPTGNIMINGTPIYPVTFIPSKDKALIFDADYVERVEVDGLKLEFFEQDQDNVEKNLITARIECQEDFNEMQPLSLIVGDFGNSSTS